MEGLIPMFYRAIKRNRIRRQYSTLSPDASLSQSYNIADFYVNPPRCHVYPSSSTDKPRGANGHRRYNSVGDYELGLSPLEERRRSSWGTDGGAAAPPAARGQQLVRFRSQRILSCLTGH